MFSRTLTNRIKEAGVDARYTKPKREQPIRGEVDIKQLKKMLENQLVFTPSRVK